MPKNLKFANNVQGADNARYIHETDKILQLEHEIKTLEIENQRLEKELIQKKQEKEEEMRCKNHAYYFILSSGNFRKFAEFHKNYRANLDYHGACLVQLYLDSFTSK